jgi:hypothetical protein
MVDWPRLEAAGISLAPVTLSPAEESSMFGGFFGGPDGKNRQLMLGCAEKVVDGSFEVVDDRGSLVVGGLSSGPITALREDLRQVGYSVEEWIQVSGRKCQLTAGNRNTFEETLGFALSQFIRHFCTLSRVRYDMALAYRESPRVWKKLFVDCELAKLVRGAAKAAVISRGGPI